MCGSSGSSIPAKLVGFKACWLIWTTSSAPFNSWLIPRKEQSSTEHVSSSYRSSWNLCEPSSSSFISFIYSWTECTLITKQPFKYIFFLLKLKKKKVLEFGIEKKFLSRYIQTNNKHTTTKKKIRQNREEWQSFQDRCSIELHRRNDLIEYAF